MFANVFPNLNNAKPRLVDMACICSAIKIASQITRAITGSRGANPSAIDTTDFWCASRRQAGQM